MNGRQRAEGETGIDAIVLAGGFARRMWPLTRDRPKQLLPIAGRPMIRYTLDKLKDIECIENVFLSTNEAFEEQFRGFLRDHGEERVKLVIEPSTTDEKKLGSIGGLGYLIRKEHLSRDTMIIGGDNIFDFHPFEAVERFREAGMDLVAVHDVGTMEKARLYGIVDVDDDGIITGFLEKPDVPPSTLAATAFYIFTAGTIRLVPEYLDEGGKADALGNFVRYLVNRKPVLAWKFPGKWFDIGSLEVYREANNYFEKISK
ncbi:MAG: nucleotidyltransferase family protein [Candidatus Thermoplasmatota archaeon]|nr:nucleotidyltransferase family protein [Candidatus Thermoplasmatota archaeon]